MEEHMKQIVRVTFLSLTSCCLLLNPPGMIYAHQQQPDHQSASTAEPAGRSQGSTAKDPGVRTDNIDAGGPLANLTPNQLSYFNDGQTRFQQVDQVANGLGPTYNSNSCASCHAQPAIGGSSPSLTQYPNIGPNPQIEAANAGGATNTIPFFITADGPVREARFPFAVNSNGTAVTNTADGGVHGLFTIAGRSDAGNCTLAQPNFEQAQHLNNLIFRIPTPTYGDGLIEAIPDSAILGNMAANGSLKHSLNISGHPNYSGNDSSITRFGWKAQNKSLVVFSGEAYNVEIGVTNEVFPNERGTPPASCILNPTPEDATNVNASGPTSSSDTVEFSQFMRFLAPPTPSSQGIPGNPSAQSIQNGKALFSQIHCDTCHTSSLQTGASALSASLSNQNAALYSDLLVHNMGSGLADHISQGMAGPDEFRTAPLWGLGQRIFFLHDGRSGPANGGLVHAIAQHASNGSEANAVISNYNNLSSQQRQDLLNFLRSL
jgi:CxxC motif-containing protein (DUF1111 family)